MMHGCPEFLSKALPRLQALAPAERHLVLWQPCGQASIVVAASNIDPERVFTTEPLSLTLLEDALSSNEVRWNGDQKAVAADSLMLTGIKCYLCVPLQLEGGRALLYADDRHHLARFGYSDVVNVLNLARDLDPRGRPGTPRAVRPQKTPFEGQRPRLRSLVEEPVASAAGSRSRESGPAPTTRVRLGLNEQASLFRIMGAFVHAGIPLLQGMSALALQGDTPRVRELAGQVHKRVSAGHRLSESLARYANFDDLVLPLLQAAESSGKLDEVFRMLSQHLDDMQERRRKLQSALVYPSFVLGAGVTMALTVPPLVLKDQLKSFGTSGLPLPTRLLLFMSNPLFWVLLAIGAAVIWRCTKIAGWQQWVPGVKKVYAAGIEVSLATSLALQLEAGVALLPAVENAIGSCRLPRGAEQAREVLSQLREGEPLVRALRVLKVLRKSFLSMLASGEESGKTVEALEWNARVCKLEYDQSLDAAVRLLEPAVMLLLGVIVGIIALGSLMPTMQLLQTA